LDNARSDSDFVVRWNLIKGSFSRRLPRGEPVSDSRLRRRERGIWQRRYWEHTIRDDEDWARHVDYIHFNPVKHGYAEHPGAWPYSSSIEWCGLGFIPRTGPITLQAGKAILVSDDWRISARRAIASGRNA
jgi:putative transposase